VFSYLLLVKLVPNVENEQKTGGNWLHLTIKYYIMNIMNHE